MSRGKITHKPHQIQIEGDVGKLIAYTKKEKPVVAIFDAVHIDKINAFKNWRAVWQNELDCQLVESKDFKDGHAIKTPVAAAILECSPNAPIRHLNGDILDNRCANLEIFDVKAQANDYRKIEAGIAVILKNRSGRVVGETLIDSEDFDLVVNSGHIWFKKQRFNGQPYVVNQDGRLLAHLLLNINAGYVAYKNKNPLDNRRANIKFESD